MKPVSVKRVTLVLFNRASKITLALSLSLLVMTLLYIFNVSIQREIVYIPKYVNQSLDQPVHWKQRLMYESKRPIVIGQQASETKFLTIGISSVYRKENYLKGTLESFIEKSSAEERENVTIVVFLADEESVARKLQINMLEKNFESHLDSGFIQVIFTEHTDLHPSLIGYRRTFNDSVERIRWRSKQALDFAFLMSYAVNISEYYMVMEDDITPAPSYLATLRNFIARRNKDRPWIALEFTEFVCIGLTFHSSALDDLSDFLLMFHEEQPVDFLIRQFIGLHVPDLWSIKRRIPSIFQHVGSKSTLKKKRQKSRDYSFDTAKRKFSNQNPPATLTTTMKIHEDCLPQNAYEQVPGIFWGIPTRETDYVTINFKPPAPVAITRVYIRSGGLIVEQGLYNIKPKFRDFIRKDAGDLEYSEEPKCKNFVKLDSFTEETGVLDTKLFSPLNVTCLRIVMSSSSWIIISEIKIFSETDNKRDTLFLFF